MLSVNANVSFDRELLLFTGGKLDIYTSIMCYGLKDSPGKYIKLIWGMKQGQ